MNSELENLMGSLWSNSELNYKQLDENYVYKKRIGYKYKGKGRPRKNDYVYEKIGQKKELEIFLG